MEKKYKIERQLVLNNVKEGGAEDRVLVLDANNEVGSVPRSEFGGGSGGNQDLQSVLDNGGSAGFDDGTKYVRFFDINGDPNAIEMGSVNGSAASYFDISLNGFSISHSTGGGGSLVNVQDGNFYLQKAYTDGSIRFSFENPQSVTGTVNIKIPSKSDAGDYTLATLDDIPTGLTTTIAIAGGGEMVFTNGILTDIIPTRAPLEDEV